MYTFRQGETVIVALDVMEGDPLTVTTITAAIALLDRGDTELSKEEAEASIPMIVTYRPLIGQTPAGWDLTLNQELDPGNYRIDAKLIVGTGVEITGESARVRVTRAAVK